MAKTENVIAGFWSKFLARITDLVIVSVVVVSVAFAIMVRNPKWEFDEAWKFYLWMFIFFIVLGFIFLIVPALWDGKTVGMFVLRIKVLPTKHTLIKSLIMRESFFALMWMMNVVLVSIIINHTLINRYARTDQAGIQYTSWEIARTLVVSSVGSITAMIQMFCAISPIVRKDKMSLHDIYSKTKVIKYNKTQAIKEVNNTPRRIKPVLIEEPDIKWIK